jgi:putative transposase
MLKTFKYRLYPSRNQIRLLEQTLETCRRWYNICLAERKDVWEKEHHSIGKYAQLAKAKEYRRANPFAAQVHSHILQVTTADLDKAFQAFFRRVKAGEQPGYPRFKGQGRFSSFGLKELGNGFKLDGRRLRVSSIGRLAVRWHRPIEGTIKTLRVVRQSDGWYACFACEVEPQPLPATHAEVGLDVGLHRLLTTSDGAQVENPRWYRNEQKRLRVLQRRMSRRIMFGRNWSKAVQAVQRQHQRIANRRKDFLNKLVNDLVSRYDRIALEDLHISNLVRNHHLSKSILDAGWSYFRQQLVSKAEYAGKLVVVVPPAYTSKTCSQCGHRFESLTLAERWVHCDCGLSLDRDHNAALNLLALGRSAWGGTWAVRATPCVPQEAALL